MECFVAHPENKVVGLVLASPDSPLGAALLGHAVGDEVAYQAPAGTMTVRITAVRPYDS
jgi:transcription elongation GreA/GreB family factor